MNTFFTYLPYYCTVVAANYNSIAVSAPCIMGYLHSIGYKSYSKVTVWTALLLITLALVQGLECAMKCADQSRFCRSVNFKKYSNFEKNCEFLEDVSSEKPQLLLKNESYNYYILTNPVRVSTVIIHSLSRRTVFHRIFMDFNKDLIYGL